MRNYFYTIILFLFSLPIWAQQTCSIIPAPQHVTAASGVFKLSDQTSITLGTPALKSAAQYIQQSLLRLRTISLSIAPLGTKGSAIHLLLDAKQKPEAYILDAEPEGITIAGGDEAGVINGISSLLQLAVAEPLTATGGIDIPCWHITDQPTYGWRGLMLDESRHFIGKEKLLSLIDWMAFYKLNRLHWHLTDEPAWRLEIRKYPKLALIGGVGDYQDPKKQTAYYSQQDVAEIVSYAAQRNITIIPEIDMPGHATAAIRAYPEYNGGGSAAHPDFTFDPAKDGTYTFLTHILRETNTLFPSGMLHLGGDEVSFGTEKWNQNLGIKKLMADSGYKDLKDVEHYFMERMADSVYKMNAKLLAWDEMADIHLPPDKTIIFWWRHDQPNQLQKTLDKGYKTVVCPRLPFYFDFVQDSTHRSGRKWGNRFSSLKDVYQFNVHEWVHKKEQQAQILGIQANLWTETVTNDNRLDYLLFPRMAALAEAAWSSDSEKDFNRFGKNLQKQFSLYREQNIYFYNPFNPSEIPEPIYFKKDRKDLNAKEN
ncbi:hexosaminidase [bacterium A37T11]|nr:hexosaminidase [bacterium A37T11]